MPLVLNGVATFLLSYIHLNLALLLHKQVLVATGVATTVVAIDYLYVLLFFSFHICMRYVIKIQDLDPCYFELEKQLK